jgi:hypothetical protein
LHRLSDQLNHIQAALQLAKINLFPAVEVSDESVCLHEMFGCACKVKHALTVFHHLILALLAVIVFTVNSWI